MDEFFDKLKDGASKAKDNAERLAKEVAKRTQNAITHTKLTIAANELQNKIKDAYAEIGKSVYEKYLEGDTVDENLKESFEQLDKLMDETAVIHEKIAELKNSLKCPECGAYNPTDADYCIKCGSHLVAEAEPSEENEYEIDDAFAEAEADEDDEDIIIINPKKPE